MDNDEFKYGNIESGAFNIVCGTETHSILPEKRKYVQEIPGLDGVVDFGISGYSIRVITKPIYYTGAYSDLRKKREEIIAWLCNDGMPKKLIFGNEPDKYYMAKIYAALEFDNTSDRHIGDIQFECNPPWQYLLDGTLLTPDEITYINCTAKDGRFIKEFSGGGAIKFFNKGTQKVKPVIKIIGRVKPGLTLSYGTAKLKINADTGFEGVKIDCAKETVTQMSDGSSLYSSLDSASTFFELSSGKCMINVSGGSLGAYPDSVTVIIEFNTKMLG